MKSGQMSVFWIFFTKNSKHTIISYIYNCFMTIFYQKTCLESCLKYDRYHNFLAFLAVFGPFFEPKTSSKVLMCWELSLKITNIIPSDVFCTFNGQFWPIFILQLFFLISNKAEAKGKFRLFLNWQLLFNFARLLAILSTESANILISFCCTSTKRAVWDQNEVLGWDLRSGTRGWCRTQNTYKFVTKKVQRLV